MKTIISGIKPSGTLHFGNYFGAIQQQLELQEKYDCYYFIADLHALISVQSKELLTKYTKDLVLDYLALGLNPDKSTLFIQSQIPAHTELSWILSTLAPSGLLDRAHAWKDIKAKIPTEPSLQSKLTIGLYTYPVLMAADILLYQTDLVPVGKDQKQHIEIARDLALKFNDTYSTDFFKLPEEHINEDVATIPGTDGRKMSKSYGNTISIFGTEKEIKKSIMGIPTDSTALEAPKNPDTCNVFTIYKLIATTEEAENLKDKYLAGNFGYGDAKKILLTKYLEYFAEAREKRILLENKVDYLNEVIEAGQQKASRKANETLKQVKKIVGLTFNN